MGCLIRIPLFFLIAAVGLAAGCQKADKPIQIMLLEDGSFTVDGQAAASYDELCALLKPKGLQRAAERARAAKESSRDIKNANSTAAGEAAPLEVSIQARSLEKCTYGQFLLALTAGCRAELEQYEIAGMRMALLSLSGSIPRQYIYPAKVGFLPVVASKPADLEPLEKHATELKDVIVLVDARMDAPLGLVVEAIKILQRGEAQFDFVVPYDYQSYDGGHDQGTSPPLTLKQPERVMVHGGGRIGIKMVNRSLVPKAGSAPSGTPPQP